MYLTYAEYQDYGGTLDETTFNEFEWEAEALINWFTFNRLKTDTTFDEAVKRCSYKLIQLAQLKAQSLILGTTDDSGSGGASAGVSASIQSQSNDGVSISYNTVSASEAFRALSSNAVGNVIEDTIQKYLNGVVNELGRKVLYRGIYADE